MLQSCRLMIFTSERLH